MPSLLHGLGYRPQLLDEKNSLSLTNAPFALQEIGDSNQEAALDTPEPIPVAAEGSTATKNAARDDSKACAVSHTVNESNAAPVPLKGRKRSPRVLYTLDGPSPFPELVTPTATAFQQVYDLLSEKHEKREMPANVPPPSQSVAGCGEVNFVLEALIRTIISTHTHMSNADKAIKNVCTRYPVFQDGDFAGSVDWDVVRIAGTEELEEAIRPAGKAKTTSVAIISILETVRCENDIRRAELRSGGVFAKRAPQTTLLSRAEILSKLADEMLLTTPSFLTLDYLHTAPAREVFERLQKFPSVGVKTAACILLFCFQYPAFAVDTHVWRLSKLLGWVPPSADRDQTFFHLDRLVPDQLKYGLHQLFIAHGKACVRCNGRTKKNEGQSESETCVLEHLVSRSNLDKPTKKKKRGPKSNSLHTLDKENLADDAVQVSADSGQVETPTGYQQLEFGGDVLEDGAVPRSKIPRLICVRKKRAASENATLLSASGLRRSKRILATISTEVE